MIFPQHGSTWTFQRRARTQSGSNCASERKIHGSRRGLIASELAGYEQGQSVLLETGRRNAVTRMVSQHVELYRKHDS